MASQNVNVRPSNVRSQIYICNATYALQVVRYTALFSGILYGIYHRRTLQARHDQQRAEHAIHDRERLIAEAKEAWKRKKTEKNSTGTSA